MQYLYMTRTELGKVLGIKIILEPIKRCWFVREDWSHYTTINGKPAHRLVFELCVGPIVNDNFVCHRCDRPGCVNPNHLFQGSAGDNYRDALKKGRVNRSKINHRTDHLKLDKLRELDRYKNLSYWLK